MITLTSLAAEKVKEIADAGETEEPTEEPVESVIQDVVEEIEIAAETTGRVCLGIELNPAYVDVAVERCHRDQPLTIWRRISLRCPAVQSATNEKRSPRIVVTRHSTGSPLNVPSRSIEKTASPSGSRSPRSPRFPFAARFSMPFEAHQTAPPSAGARAP